MFWHSLVAPYLLLENLGEAEFKVRTDLIYQKKTPKQCNTEAVAWLFLAAFNWMYKEN